MPLFEGLVETVLDVVLEGLADIVGFTLDKLFHREPEIVAVLSNYHCLGCERAGRLVMRKRFWLLYQCDTCQREWSVHRTKYVRQPGRAIEFQSYRHIKKSSN